MEKNPKLFTTYHIYVDQSVHGLKEKVKGVMQNVPGAVKWLKPPPHSSQRSKNKAERWDMTCSEAQTPHELLLGQLKCSTSPS